MQFGINDVEFLVLRMQYARVAHQWTLAIEIAQKIIAVQAAHIEELEKQLITPCKN